MSSGISQRRRIAEAVLVLGVFLAALVVFGTARATIDSDEGDWIGTTRYFETCFVRRELFGATHRTVLALPVAGPASPPNSLPSSLSR